MVSQITSDKDSIYTAGYDKLIRCYSKKVIIEKLYSKTCVKYGHCHKDHKLFLKTNYRLMQVKCIAECSKGSILQYF